MILSRITYFLNDFTPFLLLVAAAAVGFTTVAFKLYKSRLVDQQKKLLIAATTIIFSLILIFVVTEAYFRYIHDVSDGLGFLAINKKWVERHVVYNNYFYRDRDFQEAKSELTSRIGVLGDSIAWGGGIENLEDRFSNILERKLKDSGASVEVYNLGRPGYDTQQETAEFEKVRHLNFDLIIWQYFINDIQPLYKSTGTLIVETNRDLPATITFFTSKSYFLDYLYWRISPTYQQTFRQLRRADILQYSNKDLLKNHQKMIADFIRSFEGTDTQILVVIFPHIALLGPDYPAAHVHQIMTETFQKNNLEVLDLLPELARRDKKELMASKFDPHPNEDVHKLVAEKIFAKLTSWPWPPSADQRPILQQSQ